MRILLTLSCALALSVPSVYARDLNDRVWEKANYVFEHADSVEYRHHHVSAKHQVTKEEDGDDRIDADCSGFVSFVVRSVAPKHYKLMHEQYSRTSYPKAKNYAKFFESLPSDREQDGWIRVARYSDLKRGDIIAWANPHAKKGGNTGHVMIVAEAPSAVTETEVKGRKVRYVQVYVLDSSSVWHFPPESLPPRADQQHRDGLGKGNIRLVLDGDNNVVGYWEGTYWGEGQKPIVHPTMSPDIAFARLMSER